MSTATAPVFQNRFVGPLYDTLNRALWLPYGSDRLRRDLVAQLGPGRGDQVLELGCGTGLVTRHLGATGASILAVDGAPTMLSRARRRAPAATFEHRDLRTGLPPGHFDAVVLSFLLHELPPAARAALLCEASSRLAPSGRIAVLEWAVPDSRWGRLWRRLVRAIEPTVAHDILDAGLDDALAAAGLTIRHETRPANGRARILLATPN